MQTQNTLLKGNSMKKTLTVTFDYEDFNTSTRRTADCRKHGVAEIRHDAFGEGVFISGSLGCGKTRKDVGEALKEYLGGRRLLAWCIFD
jgi:DNA replication protein DnaC